MSQLNSTLSTLKIDDPAFEGVCGKRRSNLEAVLNITSQSRPSVSKKVKEEEKPEDHAPIGYYVMFEKELQTKKGQPGFNRYCPFKKISFNPKENNCYIDEELTEPLTPLNIIVGQVVWVSVYYNVVVVLLQNLICLQNLIQYYFGYEEWRHEVLDIDYPDPEATHVKRYRRAKVVRFYPKEESMKDEVIKIEAEEEHENQTDESVGMTEEEVAFWKEEMLLPEKIIRSPHFIKIVKKKLTELGSDYHASEMWDKINDIIAPNYDTNHNTQ